MHEMDYTVTLTAKDLAFRERARAAGVPSMVVSMYAEALQRLVEDEREECIAIAYMVYTQDGQSVYVTDNPMDIQDRQRTLPLYTTPPLRQWVGLTDEEYQTILGQLDDGGLLAFYILIESKLKEKNCG